MAASTTSLLHDKSVNIPFGELGSALGSALLYAIFATGAFCLPFMIEATWAAIIGCGIGGILVLTLIFLPIIIAMDVGDRIPEVREARSGNKELRDVPIRHPYLWIIILINILCFWSGLGWLVALAWACSPGRVMIPNEIFHIVFEKENPHKLQRPPKIVAASTTSPNLESQLLEIHKLLVSGVLTKEEAEARRTLILSR